MIPKYIRRKIRVILLLARSNPVLIYQMGKVGSDSLYHSLKRIRAMNVTSIHRMNSRNIESVNRRFKNKGSAVFGEVYDGMGESVFKHIIKHKKPVKIITLVREPISRNISAYFHNMDLIEETASAHELLDLDRVVDGFLTKYDHDIPLQWFDVEMKNTLGIDVYQYEFHKERGYKVIQKGGYEVLLLRHDLNDELKSSLVSDFLDIDKFTIERTNVASEKQYAEKYRGFIKKISLPDEYIDKMLCSKYAKHFYSDEELSAIRDRWAEQ